MSAPRPTTALLVAVVVHLLGIYLPSAPPMPDTPVIGIDKVVHVLLFGVPAVLAARALRHPAMAWLLLAVHAPLSEWLQAAVLPHRSGDWHDAVADVVGLALGAGLVLAGRRPADAGDGRESSAPLGDRW